MFGTFGVAGYLGYLSHDVFKDSLLFPFALSAIGVGVIAVGLFYHKHKDAIAGWLERYLPEVVTFLQPPDEK